MDFEVRTNVVHPEWSRLIVSDYTGPGSVATEAIRGMDDSEVIKLRDACNTFLDAKAKGTLEELEFAYAFCEPFTRLPPIGELTIAMCLNLIAMYRERSTGAVTLRKKLYEFEPPTMLPKEAETPKLEFGQIWLVRVNEKLPSTDEIMHYTRFGWKNFGFEPDYPLDTSMTLIRLIANAEE
jgi:hypothetical protein